MQFTYCPAPETLPSFDLIEEQYRAFAGLRPADREIALQAAIDQHAFTHRQVAGLYGSVAPHGLRLYAEQFHANLPAFMALAHQAFAKATEAFENRALCASLEFTPVNVGESATLPAAGSMGYVRGTGARALVALESNDNRLLIILEGEGGYIARIIDADDLYPTEREARFCGRPPAPSRTARAHYWQPTAQVAA